MMRKIVFVVTAAIIFYHSSASSAGAVNLICKEQGGTETKKMNKSGETQQKASELWSIPITIDTTTGKATMWGEEKEMSVEPTKLMIREYKDERTTVGRQTIISLLEINRKTLAFSYNRYSLGSSVIPSMGLVSSLSTERKTNGLCTKIQRETGNKI